MELPQGFPGLGVGWGGVENLLDHLLLTLGLLLGLLHLRHVLDSD